MAANSSRWSWNVPSRRASSNSTGVRGSSTLCTGCPKPGDEPPVGLRLLDDRDGELVPSRGVLGPGRSRSARAADRNMAASSVTPRNLEPPPSRPAARAPCNDSGALV